MLKKKTAVCLLMHISYVHNTCAKTVITKVTVKRQNTFVKYTLCAFVLFCYGLAVTLTFDLLISKSDQFTCVSKCK